MRVLALAVLMIVLPALVGCQQQTAGTDPNPDQTLTKALDAKGEETGKELPAGAAPIVPP